MKGDEAIGVEIVKKALLEPLRQIAYNSGAEGSVIVSQVMDKEVNVGYDAEKGEFVDMFRAGIVDPVKVTRFALQNAASISALLLTTECLVSDIPEKEKAPHMPPGGGGYGDMY